MAAEDFPSVNLQLFQIQVEEGQLEIIPGIAARDRGDEGLYIDPQNDYGHPTISTDPEELVLGVEPGLAANITPEGRITWGSLRTQADTANRLRFREPFGTDKLAQPAESAVGRAALLGVAERDDLHVVRVFPDPYNGTRVVHSTATEEEHRERTQLLLLAEVGEIRVAVRAGKLIKMYGVEYLQAKSRIVFRQLGGDDEGQERGSGPGWRGPDHEPRRPIYPSDSAGAAAELPPETEEKPLQAIGQQC